MSTNPFGINRFFNQFRHKSASIFSKTPHQWQVEVGGGILRSHASGETKQGHQARRMLESRHHSRIFNLCCCLCLLLQTASVLAGPFSMSSQRRNIHTKKKKRFLESYPLSKHHDATVASFSIIAKLKNIYNSKVKPLENQFNLYNFCLLTHA